MSADRTDEPTTVRDVMDFAVELRLTGLRQAARHKLQQWQNEVDDLERDLEVARRHVLSAKEDVAYWDSVRDPDEALRECGFEGPIETVISGHDFVRDGVRLRRCNRTHPCPDHGRPLGGSDWRLHSTREVFEQESRPVPGQSPTATTRPVDDAQSTGHAHQECASGAQDVRIANLPTPTPDL